jgi:mannose-1-phosphate guanylyltransferase
MVSFFLNLEEAKSFLKNSDFFKNSGIFIKTSFFGNLEVIWKSPEIFRKIQIQKDPEVKQPQTSKIDLLN